jgi:hypothetical protein
VRALYVVQEMKYLPTISLAAVIFAIVGCAPDPNKSIPQSQSKVESKKEFGTWRNLYPNNTSIVGVWIQQLPDSGMDADEYKDNHPCLVHYVFPDGMQHCFQHNPDGTIQSEAWTEAPDWVLEYLDIVYRAEVQKHLIQRAKKKKKEAQQVASSNR